MTVIIYWKENRLCKLLDQFSFLSLRGQARVGLKISMMVNQIISFLHLNAEIPPQMKFGRKTNSV